MGYNYSAGVNQEVMAHEQDRGDEASSTFAEGWGV